MMARRAAFLIFKLVSTTSLGSKKLMLSGKTGQSSTQRYSLQEKEVLKYFRQVNALQVLIVRLKAQKGRS